jgi:hypothetical protein
MNLLPLPSREDVPLQGERRDNRGTSYKKKKAARRAVMKNCVVVRLTCPLFCRSSRYLFGLIVMYLDEAEMVLSLRVTAKRKRSFSFSFHLVRHYWICRFGLGRSEPTSCDILSESFPLLATKGTEGRRRILRAFESDKTFARCFTSVNIAD